MKLKSFNPENIPQNTRIGIAKVSLNSKSGTITLTKQTVIKMDLKPNDKIEFFQDEENVDEWYIAVTKNGFDIRDKKKDQTFIFNSTFLVKKIFDSMIYNHHTGYCLLGAEPVIKDKVKYWPIITKTLKNQ